MPDRRLNYILLCVSLIVGIITVCATMLQIGSLKGQITQRIADHEIRLGQHQNKIETLSDSVIDLKARIHGIASQVGKMPSKVAAKVMEQQD